MKLKGFSFYSSYYTAITALKNVALQKELCYAIVRYAFDGELDCSSDIVRMAMELIKPNIDTSVKRSIAGQTTAVADRQSVEVEADNAHISKAEKSKRNQNQIKSKSKSNQNRNDNDNDNDNDIINPLYIPPSGEYIPPEGENKKISAKQESDKQKKFIPPTLDEVTAYCTERKNCINPETFMNFYEANGWVQGNSRKKIKCWKACVRLWEQKEKEKQAVQSLDPKLPLDEIFLKILNDESEKDYLNFLVGDINAHNVNNLKTRLRFCYKDMLRHGIKEATMTEFKKKLFPEWKRTDGEEYCY
jgi:hypothetical protein